LFHGVLRITRVFQDAKLFHSVIDWILKNNSRLLKE
jgi:hypothetical protein